MYKKNISCGIILVKIPFKIDFNDFKFDKNNIPKIELSDKDSIEKFNIFSNDIKFLMVQRSHTYEYGIFIMGKYKTDNITYLNFIFKQMTPNEIKGILTNDFDTLWKNFWKEELPLESSLNYKSYQRGKNAFNKFKEHPSNFKISDSQVKSTEWGFPKGGKNEIELDEDCAVREFKEETNINTSLINLEKNIILNESIMGTDGVRYYYKYFLATTTTDINPTIYKENLFQQKEIANIKFMNFNEVFDNINSNFIDKLSIITYIYNFILNKLLKFTLIKNDIV